MEGPRHGTEGRARAPRAAHVGLAEALRSARYSRHVRVLLDHDGQPLTQKVVQGIMRRVSRRAGVQKGVHILRHTFCSHLAMQGAPSRAIQELAGHRDLGTTQRYMHVSPAAVEDAIRLLDGAPGLRRGDNWETSERQGRMP
jgi:site-specific recombinase XerD